MVNYNLFSMLVGLENCWVQRTVFRVGEKIIPTDGRELSQLAPGVTAERHSAVVEVDLTAR